MKKLTASRQLTRTCIYCDKHFSKGEVYYKERTVFEEDGKVFARECLICPRCHYENTQRDRRFKDFQKRCNHPKKFVYTNYRYIPGECVQEPDYDQCGLCGQHV